MADITKTTSADALGLDAQAEMLKTERRANNVWNKLKRNKTAMIGLVIVVVMVFIAVFAPVLAPYDPNEIHPLDAFLKPFSEGHIFGTDQFGRDLLSRVIYGARVSLIVAAGGTLVGGVIGVLLGLIAGFMGGIVDSVIMRIMDGFSTSCIIQPCMVSASSGSSPSHMIKSDEFFSLSCRISCGFKMRIIKDRQTCSKPNPNAFPYSWSLLTNMIVICSIWHPPFFMELNSIYLFIR